MLFRRRFLDGIREGVVTLAFRRWRRPTVRPGGTLLTSIGELEILKVAPVEPDQISARDAGRAGYASREALLAELDRRTDGIVYRIELGRLRPDARVALRETPAVEEAEHRELVKRLERLDARAAEAWTLRILSAIGAHPEVRAADLCSVIGLEKEDLKTRVRKLKNLGLTESLHTGYRLSPRGAALLGKLLADRARGSRR